MNQKQRCPKCNLLYWKKHTCQKSPSSEKLDEMPDYETENGVRTSTEEQPTTDNVSVHSDSSHKNFNLSEKIEYPNEFNLTGYIREEDVQEFIKLLKEITTCKDNKGFVTSEFLEELNIEIDALAGEKLI